MLNINKFLTHSGDARQTSPESALINLGNQVMQARFYNNKSLIIIK